MLKRYERYNNGLKNEFCHVKSMFDDLLAKGIKPGDIRWPKTFGISCTCSNCRPFYL